MTATTALFYLPEAPLHVIEHHRQVAETLEEEAEDWEFFSQCTSGPKGYPYDRHVEDAGRAYDERLYRQLTGAMENGDGMDEDDEDDEEQDEEMRSKMEAKKKKAGLHALLKEDHYALLGLGQLRWEATQDQIRKAYRKKAMEHHPDKTRDHDDTMFKAVNRAFEVLSDERKRRAYDSIDEEADYDLPTVSTMEPATFFEVFGPIFQKWTKWSESKRVPKLGNENTDWQSVDQFYKFWTTFKSWRDFSYADEYDPNDAEYREERRWMERQNERVRRKKKKEEREKLMKLVSTAMKLDPRVLKQREKEEEERQRKQEEKEEKRLKKIRDQEERRAERLRQETEEKRRIEEEKRLRREEQHQKEKKHNESKQKLRELCRPHLLDLLDAKERKNANGVKGEDVEFMMLRLTNEQLDDFNKRLDELKDDKDKMVKCFKQTVKKIRDVEKKRAEESKQQKSKDVNSGRGEWTRGELSLLSKAASVFPGGAAQRWIRISEYIGTRTPDEVRKKTAEMRRTNVIQKEMSKRNAGDHFVDFQKKLAADSTPALNPVEDWTNDQQKSLENGIRMHKSLKGSAKWRAIAESVSGKTPQDCKERFDYCKQLALQKKKAQQK